MTDFKPDDRVRRKPGSLARTDVVYRVESVHGKRVRMVVDGETQGRAFEIDADLIERVTT